MTRTPLCVIPAAGHGSRIDRLSSIYPKELLPLADDVVLSLVLEELDEAGIERIAVVSRPDKPILNEYVEAVRAKNRLRAEVELLFQGAVSGNGGAILSARELAPGEPLLVVWADEVFLGPSRARQLLDRYADTGECATCITAVDDATMQKCGIAEVEGDRPVVRKIFEKPRPEQTTSRWAAVGGTILTDVALDVLRDETPYIGDELYLATALDIYARRFPLHAVRVEAQWHETGSYAGYCRAFYAVAAEKGYLDDQA